MDPRQLSLFGRERASFDASFRRLRRIQLARGAWVDHAPGWLEGHEEVFDALVAATSWRSERRTMYERDVDVPRLTASLPADGPGHPLLPRMARALAERYGERFDRVSLGYYRDGRDSVAWHGDYVARELEVATVATVSVGEPRKFLLRPATGGAAIAFSLGWGDLVVMGGSCQRTWRHSVPKVARAGPRIAIMFRPIWEPAPRKRPRSSGAM